MYWPILLILFIILYWVFIIIIVILVMTMTDQYYSMENDRWYCIIRLLTTANVVIVLLFYYSMLLKSVLSMWTEPVSVLLGAVLIIVTPHLTVEEDPVTDYWPVIEIQFRTICWLSGNTNYSILWRIIILFRPKVFPVIIAARYCDHDRRYSLRWLLTLFLGLLILFYYWQCWLVVIPIVDAPNSTFYSWYDIRILIQW